MRRAGWVILLLALTALVLQAIAPEPELWLTSAALVVAFIGGAILADHPPRRFTRRGGYIYPASIDNERPQA